MGKIDTDTLLLIGVGVVALIFLMKPATPTVPVYPPAVNPYANPYANPYGGTVVPNQTAQDISAGGTALSSLATAVSNFF